MLNAKATGARLLAATFLVSILISPSQLTAASSPPPAVVDIPIGTDFSLIPAGLNFDGTIGCVGMSCTGSHNQGRANSSAGISDRTDELRGERLVGWEYRLVQACSAQETAGTTFTQRFSYDYHVEAERSALATGAASSTIRARSDTTAQPVTLQTAVLNAGAAIGAEPGIAVPNVVLTAGKTYVSSLGAESYVKLDNSLLPGEEVTAVTGVEPTGLRLEFLDFLPPKIIAAGTTPPAINGGGSSNPSFLGYINSTSATMWVDAVDDGVAGRAMSCVDNVDFVRAGVHKQVDYTYSQVRAESDGISGEGDHVTTIELEDKQGNTATSQLHFVLDTIPPNASVSIEPPTPTGKNGWYKAPAPAWKVHCERDPTGIGAGNTAPCASTDIRQTDQTLWKPLGDAADILEPVLDHIEAKAEVRTEDKAGNKILESVHSATHKVDTVMPALSVDITTAPVYNNGWHRLPTEVHIACVDGGISGCGLEESNVSGAGWTPVMDFACITDQAWTIVYAVEDGAGNRVQRTLFFGCDFTNPLAPPVFQVATPTHTNSTTARVYSTETPRWTWGAATDPTMNGVASGVRTYEVLIDGRSGVIERTQRWFDGDSLEDGEQCIRVRAVDQAANRGAWSEKLCVTIDRHLPDIEWLLPATSTLYVEGTRVATPIHSVSDSVPAGTTTVVIGDIEVEGRFNDKVSPIWGGEQSYIEKAQIVLDTIPYQTPGGYAGDVSRPPSCQTDASSDCWMDGVNGGTPCDVVYSDIETVTCSWNDYGQAGTNEHANRLMYMRAWDHAQNFQSATRNYMKVRVAALEETCATSALSATCNTIYHALALNVDEFQAYVFYRSTSPVNIESTANIVGTVTDPNSNRWQDPGLLDVKDGETLYYKMAIVSDSGTDLEFPTMKVTHKGTAGALSVEFV